MGPHVMRRPPKFVQGFLDRHGKPRWYFRRPGFRRTPLPGLPWSPEFMAAYEAAIEGAPRIEIGAKHLKPGTVAAAVMSYFNSWAFRNLAAETRRTRRNILERFREQHGDKRIALLQSEHLKSMVAAKAGTPQAANNFLKTVRALMQHCIDQGMRTDDPTQGVRGAKIKTDGYRTWTEADIEAFEAVHPIGTRARLALALLLYTAQRRSDVVILGRQHVHAGVLHVRQRKTARSLELPIHPALQAILEATPSDHLTFLTTQAGQPFSPAGFTNWFRDRCNEAGLPRGTSAHGLRKAACRRLAEAGCSANLIAAVSGHKSLREVQRYTEAADQARMARSAMETVAGTFSGPVTRTSSVKPGRLV
jgi:integrase